ncbi:MAG: diguanylate cyclase [Magnetococcales bacterium]|nr:diguanylate cyclase [Magnetococcales bacterium]NGZ27551.1 diguanylate cyclase [Magnetococcales bacterium]
MAVAAQAIDSSVRLRMGFGQLAFLLFFILLLVWHTQDEIVEGWDSYQDIQNLMSESAFSLKVMAMVHELQRERGISVGFLANNGRLFGPELQEQRQKSDSRIQALLLHGQSFPDNAFTHDLTKNLQQLHLHLDELKIQRQNIDRAVCSSVDIIEFFHTLNLDAIHLVSNLAKPFSHPIISNTTNALISVAQLKESAGMERAILNDTFSLNRFRSGWRHKFLQYVFEQPVYEKSFLRFATEEQKEFFEQKIHDPLVKKSVQLRILAIKGQEPFNVSPVEWFEAASRRMDLLYELEQFLATDLSEQSQKIKTSSLESMVFHITFSAGVLFIAGFALVMTLLGLHQRYQQVLQRRAEMDSLLEEKNDLLEKMQDVAHMGDWSIPANKSTWKVSRGFRQLMGLPRDGVVTAEIFLQRIVAEDRPGVENSLYAILQNGGEVEMECSVPTINENRKDVYLRMERKVGSTLLKGVILDITRRKEMEGQLRHMAHHDALTGLPNRILAHDRLERALAGCQRKQCKVAILCLDLDGFKKINDQLGHDAGDQLLQDVARRLQSAVRKMDTVARMGGDEFMVLLPEVSRKEDVEPIAQKLLLALQTPFSLSAGEAHIGGSIGIALYPDEGGDVATLLKKADMALYRVKEEGKNHFRFYDVSFTME